MPNKVSHKRSLSVQEVIDLVASVEIPVLRIEKELSIPSSVLQRALRPDTKKPLPVKYEKPLLDYVRTHAVQSKLIEHKKEVALSGTGLEDYQTQATASTEEMESKKKWLEELRLAIPAARVITLFSK